MAQAILFLIYILYIKLNVFNYSLIFSQSLWNHKEVDVM